MAIRTVIRPMIRPPVHKTGMVAQLNVFFRPEGDLRSVRRELFTLVPLSDCQQLRGALR